MANSDVKIFSCHVGRFDININYDSDNSNNMFLTSPGNYIMVLCVP